MKFAYTILYVDDVPRSLDFHKAAFGLRQKMLHESGDYGELETGDTTLAMASRELMPDRESLQAGSDRVSAPFEIAFTTDDVDSAVKRALDAGATLVLAPEEKPWGQTVSYLRDINGVLVEICTPMG